MNLKSERSRSRSQSASSSSSVSRNASVRSIYSISDTEEVNGSRSSRQPRASFSSGAGNTTGPGLSSTEENNLLLSIKRENETLKKKLADLSIKRKYNYFRIVKVYIADDLVL
jgi:hypothetical protein